MAEKSESDEDFASVKQASTQQPRKRWRSKPEDELKLIAQYLAAEPHDWVGKDKNMWIQIASELLGMHVLVTDRACI